MRLLVLAVVLVVAAARPASAQWVNPYTGTNWNNPMSSFADTLIRTEMNKKLFEQAVANSQHAAPVTHEAYSKSDFVPGKQRLVVDQIIGGLTQNDAQRKGLAQGIEQVFVAFEKVGRKNNVASALAFLIAASLTVQTGTEVTDAQGEQIALALNDVLAHNPAFAKTSATDRQKIYEACVTLGGLVLLFREAGKQDASSAKAAQLLAKQSLAMLGLAQ